MVAGWCAGSTAYATPPSPTRAPSTIPPMDDSPESLTPVIAPTATRRCGPVSASASVASGPHRDLNSATAFPSSATSEREAVKAGANGWRQWWIVRHWTVPVAVVMLVAAYLTLRGHLPSLRATADAFSKANVWWLTIAVLLEAISNSMFARQQRALLRSLGVRMSVARALGVTYARSALAISMPAGSAVSAGYALNEYKRGGASTEKATAAMVLSGVISVLGLVALYVLGIVGIFVAEPTEVWRDHAIFLVAGAVVAISGVVAWLWIRRSNATRAKATAMAPAVAVDAALPTTHLARRMRSIRVATRQAVDASRSLRVRDWSLAGVFAIVNWLTDMLCLIAAARAFNLPVGLLTIAGVYLGVQLVRQIPLTPGGIGLVETGLLAGLVSAGGSTAAAAGVVLTYRVLSCWALLPLGGLAWLGLRIGKPPAPDAQPDLRPALHDAGTRDNCSTVGPSPANVSPTVVH